MAVKWSKSLAVSSTALETALLPCRCRPVHDVDVLVAMLDALEEIDELVDHRWIEPDQLFGQPVAFLLDHGIV